MAAAVNQILRRTVKKADQVFVAAEFRSYVRKVLNVAYHIKAQARTKPGQFFVRNAMVGDVYRLLTATFEKEVETLNEFVFQRAMGYGFLVSVKGASVENLFLKFVIKQFGKRIV